MVVLVGIAMVVWRWAAREGGSRFSARHLAGLVIGLTAFVMAILALGNLGDLAGHADRYAPRDLSFLAPVQDAGNALSVAVANVPEGASTSEFISYAWPAALALAVWALAWLSGGGMFKSIASILGWTLLAWAALRRPNGAPVFFLVLAIFLLVRLAIPAFRRMWELPRREAGEGGVAVVAIGLLLMGLAGLNTGCASMPGGDGAITAASGEPAVAESVSQQIRVEEKFALAKAKIHWRAAKGQMLPLVMEPAVLTRAVYPARSLKLVQAPFGSRRAQQLLAREGGEFDIEVEYQLQVNKSGVESGFMLPTQYGLINQLQLTLANLDVDVLSPQAVSVQRRSDGSNTVATLVLSPQADARVSWRPRSRDVKREKPVFYAEVQQLYVPAAGVIEGAHYATIRPAQGELSELVFNVPAGATITDVLDPNNPTPVPASTSDRIARNSAPLVSLWRFDPDTRKLRVTLSSAQSRPFALLVRSQVATGPLPVEQQVGLLSVEGAATQIGLLGVATGNEVQLDTVSADNFSAINLEDFPGVVGQTLQAQIAGLTLRRAYRYPDTKATALLKASAVEPDVRVEAQNTLSLSEDRTVLASQATVSITRAGIFKLSFALPAGMEVESISGNSLSHWTESKNGAERIITLNLLGKTEGQEQFAITLTGPGVKATNGWVTPQLVLREAGKQRGTLVVAPEQGMRLQMAARDGLTQLDPQRSGIRQKGVLAFQILQTPWNLSLDIEQVDPWIQVMSLQHATVNEAQMKVTANLQYQIENTGLKAFHVLVPTNAEGVHFQGEQVTDFLPVAGTVNDGLQEWEVKLSRRFIGQYLLQASYQVPVAEGAAEIGLRGVRAAEVNLQRGFVTVQSGGRLEVRVDAPPAALQPAEWQSIPRVLQQDLPAAPANFCYRLVDPSFLLPLKLNRHEAAKLLPASVVNVTFTSVISDDGVMLTHARLEMIPGDKRLLYVTLPADAKFWFAFVHENGVWPWREGNQILIPLEQQSRGGQPVPVEFFYSSRVGGAGKRSLDLELLAPKFDLPLENIVWRVHLNEKWQVTGWSGTLQLQQEQVMPQAAAMDTQTYLANEAGAQQEKTKEAEQMLALGNSALQEGDPQQARRAFQSAYGLSQGDEAFNEDARVQLNNLKLQQALVGLNVRQAEAGGGDAATLGGRFRDLRSRKEVAYTQQDAKDIIDRNTADENAAFMRLAERLVQQQDAAVSSPAVIRASIPEQGRVLTFQRSVVVEREADLNIRLMAAAAKAASGGARILMLAGTLVLLGLFAWMAGPLRKTA